MAKRINRTICERVSGMLSYSELFKSFWAKESRTTIDLMNMSPLVLLDDDVPERVWTGKEVSYKHLRLFGCKCHVQKMKDPSPMTNANHAYFFRIRP